MSDIAIRVENPCPERSRRISKLYRIGRALHSTALRDSLRSRHDTLLKILSRITEPTEGRAIIHGRVGSLLEVGTGSRSDPELTGRDAERIRCASTAPSWG